MGDACCSVPPPPTGISYRRALWIALFANAAMFLEEVAAAIWSGSSALAADAAERGKCTDSALRDMRTID